MTAPTPEYGGCYWPVDPACLVDDWETLDEAVQQRALALASASLERLVAYRVGVCPITVRPTPQNATCFVPTEGGYGFSPGMDTAGRWVNSCGYSDARNKGIRLPGPVGRIDEVKVDGVVLDPEDYTVIENRLMWAGEGPSPFPPTQDVALSDTEPGTMSVTYLNAYPVDSIGAHAAGVLAMEFARACTKGKCRLPKGTRSVARQGVVYDIEPGLFPDGFTGIQEVDAFIAMWNPQARTSGSRIYSPDLAADYRVVR